MERDKFLSSEKTESQNPKFLSRREASEYLGIPYDTLQFWASSKKGRERLGFYKIGRHANYLKSDLDNFIQSCKVGGVSNG
jgi:excisionase family DNA binding protein